MKVGTIMMLAAVAAVGCQESKSPVTPEPLPDATAALATESTCPCWDEARLATAFPAIHLYRAADGIATLSRFDHENAQQIQALVSLAAGGEGSCELASFGTAGRVEALAAAQGLTSLQCAACGALLAERAGGAGPAAKAATAR